MESGEYRAAKTKYQHMTNPYSDHPSEEALESFLLNRLPEAELEIVETHILACELCVEQLENIEILIAATKTITIEPEAKPTHLRFAKASQSWKDKNWNQQFSFFRLSLAGAFSAVAIGAVLFSVPREVSLSAYRGRETPIVASWRLLRLNLNATDLAEGPILVELVDNSGASVWKGPSVVHNDEVKVTLPRITKRGQHFVRLYNPAQSDAKSELLREFTFQVNSPFP
jgi:hypothetical protein